MANSPFATVRAKVTRFSASASGNFAIMLAVLAVPMISAVGIGVDLSNAYRTSALTQYALDSAVLAAGRAGQTNGSTTLAAAQTAANNYYNASKPSHVVSSNITLTADSTNTNFTLAADIWVATPFLGILSRMFTAAAPSGAPSGCRSAYSCLQIKRTATASIGAGGNGGSNVEVAVMLDVTGSMGLSKLGTLRDAAMDLIDTIIWNDQSRYTSRMAIVPFAEHVNVGSYFAAVTNRTLDKSRAPCVVDRTGNSAYTDDAPGDSAWIPPFPASYCRPATPIVPLTSNKAVLKSIIGGLTADGGTSGALGTQWAWFLLSPNWSNVWGPESAPAPYADLATLNSNGAPKLKKFAVLMTDGDYNYMSGTGQSQNIVNDAALAICAGMKTAGITVYTIGFQLSGSTARNLLTSCASSSDKFYDASSNAALIAAFRDIALKISSLRLTN
jgi:Flp pilus assembly protein TadG